MMIKKQDLQPHRLAESLYRKIPKQLRLTFFVAFALCLLVHHQAYSGGLLNHDNIGHLFAAGYGTASGRWLLPLVLRLDGSFSMPWLIGLFSALFLALSACFVVWIFRIRQTVSCIAIAALMVTFPTIAATNFYMFSADGYMLSLMLACLGAFLTVKFRYGFLLGAVSLALSAGIYQSYISMMAALLVGTLIIDLLIEGHSCADVILRGLRYLLSLVLGLALYYGMVKLTSHSVGLVDYMGISTMGQYSPKELLDNIIHAFLFYPKFFLLDGYLVHSKISTISFVLMMAAAAVLCIALIRQRKLDIKKIALLFALFVLFLLGGNLIRVFVSEGSHALMIYGGCALLLMSVKLSECIYGLEKGNIIHLCSAWMILGAVAVLSLNYTVNANALYFKSQLAEKQSLSFGNRMLTSVQETEGYYAGMELVLVGTAESKQNATPELQYVSSIGCFDMNQLLSAYTYGHFLQRYCGWSGVIYNADSEVAQRYAEMAAVQQLPVYPSKGSIQIIDGKIVVRLG